VNPIVVVNQTNVVPDYDVAVSPRRWTESSREIPRYRPNPSPHVGRQHKPLSDIRLPVMTPVSAFILPEVIMMTLIPVAGGLTVVVVEVVVNLPMVVGMAVTVIVVVPLIVIVIVPVIVIVAILSLCQSHSEK
jgi:hypothetical protein